MKRLIVGRMEIESRITSQKFNIARNNDGWKLEYDPFLFGPNFSGTKCWVSLGQIQVASRILMNEIIAVMGFILRKNGSSH